MISIELSIWSGLSSDLYPDVFLTGAHLTVFLTGAHLTGAHHSLGGNSKTTITERHRHLMLSVTSCNKTFGGGDL